LRGAKLTTEDALEEEDESDIDEIDYVDELSLDLESGYSQIAFQFLQSENK